MLSFEILYACSHHEASGAAHICRSSALFMEYEYVGVFVSDLLTYGIVGVFVSY
jgi:hypothetical protein